MFLEATQSHFGLNRQAFIKYFASVTVMICSAQISCSSFHSNEKVSESDRCQSIMILRLATANNINCLFIINC